MAESAYEKLKGELAGSRRKWLVTGVAGFIGSNLLETLLRLGQEVRGFDDFSTGKARNLELVRSLVRPEQWAQFEMVQGTIADPEGCARACQGVDYVLHQAALGSVPRSVEDPFSSHTANVTGFLRILCAARDARVKRFVYASSSAVYGDAPELPKIEPKVGAPLSPYGATKMMNELYAQAFAACYGTECIGLRYFNVFGPRQDPDGAYAAVIPGWIAALIRREPVYINGDGETSRDFCYVDNVVQANLLAATCGTEGANQAYNIALGGRTTLNELFVLIQDSLRKAVPELPRQKPVYRDFRPGDVRHSLADITKARSLLKYEPTHRIGEGLDLAMSFYLGNLGRRAG